MESRLIPYHIIVRNSGKCNIFKRGRGTGAVIVGEDANLLTVHGVPEDPECLGPSGSIVWRNIKTLIPWETVKKTVTKTKKESKKLKEDEEEDNEEGEENEQETEKEKKRSREADE